MRKFIVIAVILGAAAAGGAWYYRSGGEHRRRIPPISRMRAAARVAAAAGGRAPMTVDMAPATRHEVVDYITVVGNLIGEATVDVVPRVGGRIESIPVKLGDRVTQGPDRSPRSKIARSASRSIRRQANLEVNKANGRAARERRQGRRDASRRAEGAATTAA